MSFLLKNYSPLRFQSQMIEEFFGKVALGYRRILFCAGTGAGKTFMSGLIIKRFLSSAEPGTKVCFLVDLNCLVDQAIAEFSALGVNCAPYQGSKSLTQKGMFRLGMADAIVASIQTLESRGKKVSLVDSLGDIGLFVVDECHTTAFSKAYSRITELYPKAIFLGLSATVKTQAPGDRFLGRFFNTLVVAPPMPEMIRLGRCVPFRMFSPGGVIDVASLHIDDKTGDYNLLEQEYQVSRKYSEIVRLWLEKAEGRSTTVYCPTIASANGLAEVFREEGKVRSEVQDGNTPMGLDGVKEHAEGILTRASQDYRLDRGMTKVVCSVGTQVKGWNLPSLGCIVLARAILSESFWLQIVGRGSRACSSLYWKQGKKENCFLLDFGENLERFSPVDPNNYGTRQSDYFYGEILPARSFSPGEAKIGIKQEVEKEKEIVEEGEILGLYEWFDKGALSQLNFLRKAKKAAYLEGRSPTEAANEFYQEYGFQAPLEWHEGAVFGYAPSQKNKQEFREYLERFSPGSAGEWFAELQFKREFGHGKFKGKIKEELPWNVVLGVSSRSTKRQAQAAYQRLVNEREGSRSPKAKKELGILAIALQEALKLAP